MRIDPEQEKLSIKDIITGLKDLERFILTKDESFENKSGFIGLVIACRVFDNLVNGPFPILYNLPKIRDLSMHVAAAMDLVRYFNRVEKKSQLKGFKNHLRLVGIVGFGLAATYSHQQKKGSSLQGKFKEFGIETLSAEMMKDASRKSIELMLGFACLNKFDEVSLEDPGHSDPRNPNPDVLIRHGENKYGIACKSLNSKNITSVRERVGEAIGQIEAAYAAGKIDKHRGMVFLDLSALLNHDELYLPSEDSVWDSVYASQILVNVFHGLLAEIFNSSQSLNVSDQVGDLFEGKNAAPCLLIYAHSLMISGNSHSAAPHYYKIMKVLFAGDHSRVKGFAELLNRGLHGQ